MKNLHDWLFWFDTMSNQWRTAKREDMRELFNNHKSDKVLRSSSIDTLVDLIARTNGDKTKIDNLLKNNGSNRTTKENIG